MKNQIKLNIQIKMCTLKKFEKQNLCKESEGKCKDIIKRLKNLYIYNLNENEQKSQFVKC